MKRKECKKGSTDQQQGPPPKKQRYSNKNCASPGLKLDDGYKENGLEIDYNALSRHLCTLDTNKFQRTCSVNLVDILHCEAQVTDEASMSSDASSHDDHKRVWRDLSHSKHSHKQGMETAKTRESDFWCGWGGGGYHHHSIQPIGWYQRAMFDEEGDFIMIPDGYWP